MRWLRCVLVVVMFVPGLTAQEEQKPEKRRRVRAVEPTVVTVEGRVNTEQPKRSVPAKIGHGIKTGVVGVGKAVLGLTGWLLNTEDDIPSERERKDPDKPRRDN